MYQAVIGFLSFCFMLRFADKSFWVYYHVGVALCDDPLNYVNPHLLRRKKSL